MKFASFGRDKDKYFVTKYVADPLSRDQLLRLTDAAHDLKDGAGNVQTFIDAARAAAHSRYEGVRDNALSLLERVSRYHPECLQVYREMATSASWVYRFAVACRLYWHIQESLSDSLFSVLRHDKSNRVRNIAVDRYECRPDSKGYIRKVFDAQLFDDRVRRGEVTILRVARAAESVRSSAK